MPTFSFKPPANTHIVEQYWQPMPDGTRTPVALVTVHNVSGQFTLFVWRDGAFVKQAVSAQSPKFKQIKALYPEDSPWQNEL